MREALVSLVALIVMVLIGKLFKPNADQLKPLEPQPGATGDAAHGHH